MPGPRPLLLAALVAVFVGVDRVWLGEVVLDVAMIELFARDARGLQRSWVFDHGRRSGHDLPRSSRSQHHIGKLALGSFRQHIHVSLSLQTMPEVVRPAYGAARPGSAARLRWPALPCLHVPHLHSLHNSRNICWPPKSRRAPWPGGAQFLHPNPDRGCASDVRALRGTAAK